MASKAKQNTTAAKSTPAKNADAANPEPAKKASPTAAKSTPVKSAGSAEGTPAKKAGAGTGASGKKVNPALMRPLQPSKELAAVVGSEPPLRAEVVSKVWDYIKTNNLQNPTNSARSRLTRSSGPCSAKTA